MLHEADSELAKSIAIEVFSRSNQISLTTYFSWKQKYGGLTVYDAKRLKALEVENFILKFLPVELYCYLSRTH